MNNRLRELREARGLSLEELARRAGTSNQQISHLELGRRRLTVDWLFRLATALGCQASEILGLTPEPLLTELERALVSLFRDFSPEQQAAFLALAATIAQPAKTNGSDIPPQ